LQPLKKLEKVQPLRSSLAAVSGLFCSCSAAVLQLFCSSSAAFLLSATFLQLCCGFSAALLCFSAAFCRCVLVFHASQTLTVVNSQVLLASRAGGDHCPASPNPSVFSRFGRLPALDLGRATDIG